MKKTISVVVITKDEEKNIGTCLESVKWADEIIVVDACSSDGTAEIAKRYTDKVILHEWVDFFEQRCFALGLATGDFVLILDADEALDDEAKDEIKNMLARDEWYDGYWIVRDTYFLGRRLAFTERPDPILRLFKREAGFVTNKVKGHEDYTVAGTTRLLPRGVIKHYTAGTISEKVTKANRYSNFWAEERALSGLKLPYFVMIVYVIFRSFVGNFIIKGGFRDGYEGFVWCVIRAFENFLKISKLWELRIH